MRQPEEFTLDCRGIQLALHERTHIMGILNLTPDSFYDGGKYLDPEIAVERALEMVSQGADLIDVGGESTRPGAEPVTIDQELDRIMPVLEILVKEVNVPLSVDTYKSEVAKVALETGAHLINDISALRFDPRMADVVKKFQVPVILMHIKGKPKDMQINPTYQDVMAEIISYLNESIKMAVEKGIERRKIIVDPGIGFGKRIADNYEILRRLEELKVLSCPILIGPSRKSFIGQVLNLPPDERIEGTVVAAAAGIWNGAHIIRVHDVKELVRASRIADVIIGKVKI